MPLRRLPPLLGLLLALAPLPAFAAPEHWKAEIDQLTANDATQPLAPGGAVFVGSSSIRLWRSLAADFPGRPVLNRGFGGSQLADSVHYFDRLVAAHRPSIVVLYAGENDLNDGKTPEQVAADFAAFRAKIQADLPGARLFYLSIKLSPSREKIWEGARRANALIAAACAADPRCTFVDLVTPMTGADGRPRAELFGPDRLHLNADGYALWTSVLRPLLPPHVQPY